MTPTRVLIAGGGLAGLTAAKRLADGGFAVTLLEKRPILGGKWSAWQDEDGDWIETGLHVFFGAYDEIFTLMRELGSYAAIDWKAHHMVFTMSGGARYELRFAPLPGFFATAPTLLFNHYFSARQKWSLIKAGLPLFLGGDKVLQQADSLSYTEWHARFGIHDRLLQRLFLPVALAAKFVPPDQLSAKLVIELSRLLMGTYGHGRIGMLRGSPESYLTGPLALSAERAGAIIRRDTRVTGIETDSEGAISAFRVEGPSGPERLSADYYLTALPIHNLKRLIPEPWQAHPYFGGLMQLEGAPVITLHLWLDRVIGQLDHLLFSPDGILPVYADMARTTPDYRNSRTPGSRFQFVIAPAADLMARNDDEIIALALADLARLFPGEVEGAHVLKHHLIRIPQSVYWPRPGTDRFRVSQQSPIPNLFLAGGYTLQRFYDSMEGAVRSGNRAAAALMATADGRPWRHTL